MFVCFLFVLFLLLFVKEWALKKIKEQDAVPPHEDPAYLAHEVEEQNKKLDREVMYLVNKIRAHPPPSFKTPSNKTNATDTNRTEVSLSMWAQLVCLCVHIIMMSISFMLVLKSTCYARLW